VFILFVVLGCFFSKSGRLLLLSFLFHFLSGLSIDKISELISLLGLPLRGASLKFLDLHLFEALMISIVPLEHILHTLSLLLEFEHLFPPILRFELRQVLLDQIKLYDMLMIGSRRY
jgi:hypothetical protein